MQTKVATSWGALLGILACFAVPLTTRGGDRQDSPDLQSNFLKGPTDLAGLYVFRSPTNANNTVLVLLAAPHAQIISRPVFDPKARYDFKIDSTEDFKPDLTFRAQFSPPDINGSQKFKLRKMIGRRPFQTIAEGSTGTNVAIIGGGQVRVGLFDDPFFFDAFALNDLVAEGVGVFPRPGGSAKNFYGPNANILGIVIEVPSTGLVKEGAPANGTVVAVWGRVLKNGIQIDRVGRPLTNLLLVPPVPRIEATKDMRMLFNRGQPANDRRRFGPSAANILQSFFGRTEADANAIVNILMPDVLFFQLGNPNGFGTFVASSTLGTVLGNGRRLRDDTFDIIFNILSNGAITTDNVSDDNVTRITDGNLGTFAAFPYVGAPNFFVNGPNP